MNERDWENWFDRPENELSPRDLGKAKREGESGLRALGAVHDYIEDSAGVRALEEAEKQIEEALDQYASIVEKATELLEGLNDELLWHRDTSAMYLAENYSVPIPKEKHDEVWAWVRENLTDDYISWNYRDRSILVLFSDTDKVLFKLRWSDELPDLP